ncbi:MAG: hypothetical protein QM756_22625 [Polyangiaceae bacterium]
MVVAVPSMIYGIVTSVQCRSVRRETERMRHAPAASAERQQSFSGSVFGYAFGANVQGTESACAAEHGSWQFAGSVGECSLSDPSLPTRRLHFEFGALQRIVLVYRPDAERLKYTFDRVAGALRLQHGAPDSADDFSAECAESLAQCLLDGERPGARRWRFSAGSVELNVVQNGEHAEIQVVYQRAEPASD